MNVIKLFITFTNIIKFYATSTKYNEGIISILIHIKSSYFHYKKLFE